MEKNLNVKEPDTNNKNLTITHCNKTQNESNQDEQYDGNLKLMNGLSMCVQHNKEKNEKIKKINPNLTTLIENYKTNSERLTMELAMANANTQKLDDSDASVKTQIKNVNYDQLEKIENSSFELQNAMQKIEESKIHAENLKNTNFELQEKIDALESANRYHETFITNLQDRIDLLRDFHVQEKHGINKEKQNLFDENVNLNTKLNENSEQFNLLSTEFEIQTNDFNKLAEKHGILEKNKNTLKKTQNHLIEKLQNTSEENQILRKKVKKLESYLQQNQNLDTYKTNCNGNKTKLVKEVNQKKDEEEKNINELKFKAPNKKMKEKEVAKDFENRETELKTTKTIEFKVDQKISKQKVKTTVKTIENKENQDEANKLIFNKVAEYELTFQKEKPGNQMLYEEGNWFKEEKKLENMIINEQTDLTLFRHYMKFRSQQKGKRPSQNNKWIFKYQKRDYLNALNFYNN